MTLSKEPRNHRQGKHIERKYHLILEIVQMVDVVVENIPFAYKLIDLFTMTLKGKAFDGHRDNICAKCVLSML